MARVSAIFACAAVAACGPGLEATHENTLRFEHCYRLDMDRKIAPSHREHCWRDWTETYAEGQPLDRVDYAHRRITQLESGDTRLLAIKGSGPGARVFVEELSPSGSAEAPMAAPAPTSAHAPPPKTAPAPEAPGSTGSAGSTVPKNEPPRPEDTCTVGCGTTLDGCNRLCETKQADCATCREDYRHCMRRCFD